MKIRSLIVAAIVLAALGGTLYWSGHRKPAGETAKASADAPPAVLKLDESAITRFELKKKDSAPIVLSKSSSGWQIVHPRPLQADQSAVSSAVTTLASLNSERLIEDKASDLKQFGLDQPAVEVDITEQGDKRHRLLIGDETPAGNAVYAMLSGDPRVFTIAGYHKTSIDKSLNDLRDKRLLTIDRDKITRLELIRRNQTIEFGRNQEAWQILKPRPLRADTYQVDELARKLSDARMELGGNDNDFKEAASAFGRATRVAAAKVTGQSGTEEIEVRRSKGVYYAKSSIVEGVYRVDSNFGQVLDKNLDDFRNKKLFDFGYTDPKTFEIHSGGKAYFLTKSGEDWWSSGKKMDAGTVQDVISKLRNLTASKFVESGFSTPSIEVSVTSDDGKRIERIAIAKSGGSYIAKRENEPTLYQIDAIAIEDLQKATGSMKSAEAAAK